MRENITSSTTRRALLPLRVRLMTIPQSWEATEPPAMATFTALRQPTNNRFCFNERQTRVLERPVSPFRDQQERKSACVPDFLQVVSNSHDFVILSRVEEFFEQRPCAAGAL